MNWSLFILVVIFASTTIIAKVMATEKKIDLTEIRDEVDLLIWNIDPVKRHLAKLYDPKGRCVETQIFTGSKRLRPIFLIHKTFDLDQARKFCFEFVQQYRTLLAESEAVKKFYKEKRPNYNLERDLFPLELTWIRISFFDNDHNLCSPPLIAEMGFDGAEFHYYVDTINTDKVHRVYQEKFANAQAFYNTP